MGLNDTGFTLERATGRGHGREKPESRVHLQARGRDRQKRRWGRGGKISLFGRPLAVAGES